MRFKDIIKFEDIPKDVADDAYILESLGKDIFEIKYFIDFNKKNKF